MNFNLFVGIDISKPYFDAAVLIDPEQPILCGRFLNEKAGFNKLMKWIKSNFLIENTEILFCMEHTGIYSIPLCSFFGELGLNYSLNSALQVKRSMGMQRGKNDKADAKMLAKYAYLYRSQIKPSTLPSKPLMILRNLLSYRERLVKNKLALQASAKELAKFTAQEEHRYILQDSLKNIRAIQNSITDVDKEIIKVIKSEPQLNRLYELAVSIPGIGTQITAHMFIYTNGFTCFSNWRKFACYCGLAPFEYTSGISIRGKTRVSKMANRKMKSLIGNGAMSAILCDKELSLYYKKKLSQGKPKLVAMNAVKNKLISRIFAIIKRGTPYVRLVQYV